MLRSMTAKQFIGWWHYFQIDPFGEKRADYRAASIVTMIANVNRDPKQKAQPYQLEDFILKFGQAVRKQTPEDQLLVAKLWAAAFSKGG